jgi:hypothetical protein
MIPRQRNAIPRIESDVRLRVYACRQRLRRLRSNRGFEGQTSIAGEAGDSMKPEVEQSGTPGLHEQPDKARETGDRTE